MKTIKKQYKCRKCSKVYNLEIEKDELGATFHCINILGTTKKKRVCYGTLEECKWKQI
jgi:hypothetical protein